MTITAIIAVVMLFTASFAVIHAEKSKELVYVFLVFPGCDYEDEQRVQRMVDHEPTAYTSRLHGSKLYVLCFENAYIERLLMTTQNLRLAGLTEDIVYVLPDDERTAAIFAGKLNDPERVDDVRGIAWYDSGEYLRDYAIAIWDGQVPHTALMHEALHLACECDFHAGGIELVATRRS